MVEKKGWEGRFYEDFDVGDVYRLPYGRTINEADNTWMTLLTLNPNPIHFDAELAKRSEFGRILVNSGLTVALVLGMSVADTSQNAFANLGWEEIRLTHPLFVGDTVYVESRVLGKRESKSRPSAGIVTVETRGLNQDGVTVIDFKRSFYVHKREASQARVSFPEPVEPWTSD